MSTRLKRKQDVVEEALQALPSDGSDEEDEEEYEEDFEASEGDEDDEEEEDEEDAAAASAADAAPAPVPAPAPASTADEPIAEIASRPSKKRKLAPPKHAEDDVQDIFDEDDAGAPTGADGAEEEEEGEGEEEDEEEDYESENGGVEVADLLPRGKKDSVKSNVKAPLKSAELVGNDDDEDE